MKTIIKTIAAGAFILASGLVAAEPLNLSSAEMDSVSAGWYTPTFSLAASQTNSGATGPNSSWTSTYSNGANGYGAYSTGSASANGGYAAGGTATSMALFIK